MPPSEEQQQPDVQGTQGVHSDIALRMLYEEQKRLRDELEEVRR